MANQDKETLIRVEIRLYEVEKRCEGLAERLEKLERGCSTRAAFSAHFVHDKESRRGC